MGRIRRSGVRPPAVLVAVFVVVGSLAISAIAFATPGGRGWSIQPTPNPEDLNQLHGVACTSASACIAVGWTKNTDGTGGTLAERWDGTKWSLQPIPTPAVNPPNGALNGISCTSASACTAVGDYYRYEAKRRHYIQVTLAERWDGTKWTIQPTPNPTGGWLISLNGVSCASARDCTAVGAFRQGTRTDLTGPFVTLAERWDGTKWTIQQTPKLSGSCKGHIACSVGGLSGVSCASASVCTAVGDAFDHRGHTVALAERWDGHQWTIQRTPKLNGQSGCARSFGCANDAVFGVSCASANVCTAVGSYQNNGHFVTLAERWNGTRWFIQSTPYLTHVQNRSLSAVSCASARVCTAVGGHGITGRTLAEHWNGRKWTIQRTPKLSASQNGLASVACASARACAAVGSQNGYTNLAESWNGG